MRPVVPETTEGALLLSLIDFVLSVVMISGVGFVLALLPLVNRLGEVDEEALLKSEH
jgi:hypothetical protein